MNDNFIHWKYRALLGKPLYPLKEAVAPWSLINSSATLSRSFVLSWPNVFGHFSVSFAQNIGTLTNNLNFFFSFVEDHLLCYGYILRPTSHLA